MLFSHPNGNEPATRFFFPVFGCVHCVSWLSWLRDNVWIDYTLVTADQITLCLCLDSFKHDSAKDIKGSITLHSKLYRRGWPALPTPMASHLHCQCQVKTMP